MIPILERDWSAFFDFGFDISELNKYIGDWKRFLDWKVDSILVTKKNFGWVVIICRVWVSGPLLKTEILRMSLRVQLIGLRT